MGVPPATHHPEPLVVLRWTSTPLSVSQARGSLRRTLQRWELTELTDTAELVLSELLTNSIQHCEVEDRYVETRFARDRDGVRIEVHDASDRRPEPHKAAEDDERGRGLALVDAVTGGRWGVSAREGVGKQTWAHVIPCGDDAGDIGDRAPAPLPRSAAAPSYGT